MAAVAIEVVAVDSVVAAVDEAVAVEHRAAPVDSVADVVVVAADEVASVADEVVAVHEAAEDDGRHDSVIRGMMCTQMNYFVRKGIYLIFLNRNILHYVWFFFWDC